jgi:hypothetical protein
MFTRVYSLNAYYCKRLLKTSNASKRTHREMYWERGYWERVFRQGWERCCIGDSGCHRGFGSGIWFSRVGRVGKGRDGSGWVGNMVQSGWEGRVVRGREGSECVGMPSGVWEGSWVLGSGGVGRVGGFWMFGSEGFGCLGWVGVGREGGRSGSEGLGRELGLGVGRVINQNQKLDA